jgi:hypothetical protein
MGEIVGCTCRISPAGWVALLRSLPAVLLYCGAMLSAAGALLLLLRDPRILCVSFAHIVPTWWCWKDVSNPVVWPEGADLATER